MVLVEDETGQIGNRLPLKLVNADEEGVGIVAGGLNGGILVTLKR